MTAPAIVITGASSGIGLELAHIAAGDGLFMLLIGLPSPSLKAVADEISASGAKTHALEIDLRHPDAPDRIEAALSELGLHCHILVNCAGYGVFGPAAEADRERQVGVLDVNARALTALTLRFLPGMVARGRGGVLNVGSITGYAPGGPHMSVYFATKAYVKSFSLALAAEVAGSGVSVTCLAPGVVRTPFFDHCEVHGTRLFKLAPRSNARDIAEAGWRGFKAGKRIVIPRMVDRVIAALCTILPDAFLLRLIANTQRPR